MYRFNIRTWKKLVFAAAIAVAIVIVVLGTNILTSFSTDKDGVRQALKHKDTAPVGLPITATKQSTQPTTKPTDDDVRIADMTTEATRRLDDKAPPQKAPSEDEGDPLLRHITVSEGQRDYFVVNFTKILHDVKIKTAIAPDGTRLGLEISRAEGSTFISSTGGLKTGDIIKSINGNQVDSVRRLMILYEELARRKISSVQIQFERNNKLLTHTYAL